MNVNNSEMMINTFQNVSHDNVLNQIKYLENKLENNQKKYDSSLMSLTSEINSLQKNEIELKKLLNKKDEAFDEFNDIIKDYQTELMKNKTNLYLKENELNSLKDENNKLKNSINEIKLLNSINYNDNNCNELNQTLEEYGKALKISNLKIYELEKEKYDIENKLNIINEENKNLKYKNDCLENSIKNLKKEYQLSLEENKKLLNENSIIKYENNSLKQELSSLNMNYNKILSENSHLNELISNLNNIKDKLKSEMTFINKENQKYSSNLLKYEKEINGIIEETNDDIKMIINWIENYMGIYISNNLKIPQLPLHRLKNNGIIIDELKTKIMLIRERVNKDIILLEDIKNKKKLIEDNEDKKLNNENYNKLKDLYNFIKSEIDTNKYFTIEKSIIPNDNDKIISTIEFVIKNQLLPYIKKNDIKKFIEENESLKKYNNNLQKELNSLKLKFENLQLEKLNNENNLMRNNSNNYIQDNFDRLKQEYLILEKKNKSLITENELKQMQINSLEKMLSRRGIKGINSENSIDKNNFF